MFVFYRPKRVRLELGKLIFEHLYFPVDNTTTLIATVFIFHRNKTVNSNFDT